MQVRKRSWYRKLPLLLIPLLIAVAALQLKERLSVPPVAPGKPLPVRVVEVAPQDIEFVRSYTARIEDRERAALSARLNSVVDAVRVRRGDRQAGDLLIELDDRDVRAEMKRSMALVRQVKADLLFQEKQIVVDRELYREGGISKLELDNAERKLEGLAATLSQHESSLRLAEQKLDYTRIRAPIGGRVQSIDISEGEHAAAGRPLIEIVSRDSYKAVVALPGGICLPSWSALSSTSASPTAGAGRGASTRSTRRWMSGPTPARPRSIWIKGSAAGCFRAPRSGPMWFCQGRRMPSPCRPRRCSTGMAGTGFSLSRTVSPAGGMSLPATRTGRQLSSAGD